MTEETKEEYSAEEDVGLTAEEVEEVDPVAVEVAEVISPSKERGIKETMEVMEALDVLGEFVGKMLADGQVSGADFVHVVSLFKSFDSFSAAISGAGDIDDELKDLDAAEVTALGVKAFNIVKKIVKATKKKK